MKNYKTFPKTTKQNEKLQNKNYKRKTTKEKLQIKNYKTNMILKKGRAEAPPIFCVLFFFRCRVVSAKADFDSSLISITRGVNCYFYI